MQEAANALDSKVLLGRYRVVRLLGEGGMGTVYLARVEGAEGFTRPVVVKRMRTDIKATEEGNRLFIREAQILSKMQHPGIINIIDFGVEDGAHIMVLEYVHGYTLAPLLDYRYAKKLPLPVDICLYIVRRILDALHYAHHFDTEEGQEVEIVHRDVAPDNVLLSKKGYVHLLDFGIASMTGPNRGNSTKSGVFRGKLGYAAPETVDGAQATPRSDQYSAAVLLLELLIQETPFFSDSIGETVVRMVNEIPDPPSKRRDDIPPGLDEALGRALAKKPLERFESALEFSRELRKFQQHDDEEVAVHLKKLVRQDFEDLPSEVGVEHLKVREEALARIFPKGLSGGMMDSIIATEEMTSAAELSASPQVTVAAQGQQQMNRLLLGLLVVGGVIALSLGAAVALLSKGGTGEQVVVVGGENPNARDSDPEKAAPTAPETNEEPDEPSEPTPEDTTEEAAQDVDPQKPAPKAAGAKPMSKQQKLSTSVQKQSGAFQNCFASRIKEAEKHPEAILHFSVGKSGGIPEVQVEPPALAKTGLGACLKGAAAQVRFPELGEGVSFRVPVRARLAQFDK